MTLLIVLIVFVTWTLYRLLFPINTLLDEIILKPTVWLMPVVFVTKANFANLGFTQKNIVKNIIIGLSVGLIMSLERIFLKQYDYRFSLAYLVTPIFTAITEEIFFRGYLLKRWLKYFKNPAIPLLLNATIFTCFHIPLAIFLLHYSGYELFSYLLTNFIFGSIDVILFYLTGSIYASIANHFVWNTFSGLFR